MAAKRAKTAAMAELEGRKAPAFKLPDASGNMVALSDLLAKGKLVLYFYPKDMTPGCTAQASSFRDHLDAIRKVGAEVAGISADPTASHAKFAAKNALNFTLLSDPDHEVARLYRVYRKKSLYGREFMGIERTTFLIGRDGIIRKVFPKVNVKGHSAEVLAALTELG